MATYTFAKEEMRLKVRVMEKEPYFNKADVQSSVGVARAALTSYLARGEWIHYNNLIDAIDAVERDGAGMGRRRVNPIYMARIERFRAWIEWEVIPQLAKIICNW